MQLQINAAI